MTRGGYRKTPDKELEERVHPIVYNQLKGKEIKECSHVFIKGEIYNQGEKEYTLKGWMSPTPLGGRYSLVLSIPDENITIYPAFLNSFQPDMYTCTLLPGKKVPFKGWFYFNLEKGKAYHPSEVEYSFVTPRGEHDILLYLYYNKDIRTKETVVFH